MVAADKTESLGDKPVIAEGKPAPDFTLLDENGKKWRLSKLKGKKNVVLAFYPKDFTGG